MIAPLADLASCAAGMQAPALVVIGDVVALAARLAADEPLGIAAA